MITTLRILRVQRAYTCTYPGRLGFFFADFFTVFAIKKLKERTTTTIMNRLIAMHKHLLKVEMTLFITFEITNNSTTIRWIFMMKTMTMGLTRIFRAKEKERGGMK